MRLVTALVLAMAIFGASVAQAQEKAPPPPQVVRLGALIGASWPFGQPTKDFQNGMTTLSWGFQFDLPIIRTFHLMPSIEIYRFGKLATTDASMAFAFIVPMPTFDLYLGIEPGITTVGEYTLVHGGGVGGATLPLMANVDLFVQVKYKMMAGNTQNNRVLHANVGALYHF